MDLNEKRIRNAIGYYKMVKSQEAVNRHLLISKIKMTMPAAKDFSDMQASFLTPGMYAVDVILQSTPPVAACEYCYNISTFKTTNRRTTQIDLASNVMGIVIKYYFQCNISVPCPVPGEYDPDARSIVRSKAKHLEESLKNDIADHMVSAQHIFMAHGLSRVEFDEIYPYIDQLMWVT